MPRAVELVLATVLDAPPAAVWERVASLEGVNDEFGGLLRMTAPPRARIDDPTVPRGRRWIRSRLLLFGVLPVERDDVTFVRVEPGRGFLERSSMLTMRVWEHERTLEPLPGGATLVRDRLRAVPRLPVPAVVPRAVVGRLFRRRQRRLRAAFAEACAP